MSDRKLFGTDGIRGTANQGAMTAETALRVGMAAGLDCRTCTTVEEVIALRDYLVVTRAVDPIALEQARIAQVTAGFSPGQQGQRAIRPDSMLDALSYVTFQELATRVSLRNTGRACDEPIADRLFAFVKANRAKVQLR